MGAVCADGLGAGDSEGSKVADSVVMRCLLISSLEAKPAQAQLLKQKERLRLAALSTFLGHAWLSFQTMTNLPFRSTVFLRHSFLTTQ